MIRSIEDLPIVRLVRGQEIPEYVGTQCLATVQVRTSNGMVKTFSCVPVIGRSDNNGLYFASDSHSGERSLGFIHPEILISYVFDSGAPLYQKPLK